MSGAASATTVSILAASDDAVHAINNMANGMTVALAAETGTTVTSMTLDTAGTDLTIKTGGDTTTTVNLSDVVNATVLGSCCW